MRAAEPRFAAASFGDPAPFPRDPTPSPRDPAPFARDPTLCPRDPASLPRDPTPSPHPTAPHPRRAAPLVDAVAHQAAWWCCVLAARTGAAAVALLGPATYAAWRLAAARDQRLQLVRLALFGAAVGALGDATLASAGLVRFPAELSVGPVAPFMAALWAIATLSLTLSSAFLTRLHPLAVASLGALAGPFAYAGGARLGVLSLGPGALAGIACEWALALPLLASSARRLVTRSGPIA